MINEGSIVKESSLGGFSPNSWGMKTITLLCNPGNDIPVKGEMITKELRKFLVRHFLTNLHACLSLWVFSGTHFKICIAVSLELATAILQSPKGAHERINSSSKKLIETIWHFLS